MVPSLASGIYNLCHHRGMAYRDKYNDREGGDGRCERKGSAEDDIA
jgi:hypothetical protein